MTKESFSSPDDPDICRAAGQHMSGSGYRNIGPTAISSVQGRQSDICLEGRGVLPPSGPLIIAEDWQGVLRHAVLEAMPISELGAEGATHFLAPRIRGWPLSPMTWARSFGKGRVFYTSMGHREDVWENPKYQGLLIGALAWAAGKVDANIEPNIKQVTPGYKDFGG